MTTQYLVRDKYGRNSDKEFVVHETELLSQEARLACTMIEKWGMVSGEIDGKEDSAGRAILRNSSPEEIVNRACSTAELAMKQFRERGWIVQGPDVSELTKTSTEEK